MGAGDYENLGFQVGVDGADSAVSHLDKIIERLERIANLQGSVSKTGKSGGLSKEELGIKKNNLYIRRHK